MHEASFDESSGRAAISGVYQYDTGQRLRLRGIPSPSELAGKDDFLDGVEETPMVQVHYGYEGDSQSEMCLAVYDEVRGWLVDIPDAYLTRAEPVHLYVQVFHGERTYEDDSYVSRARTMYEGVFTPIRRPAPSNTATPEQWEAWEVMLAEIEDAIAKAKAAAANALAQIEPAEAAEEAAQQPTQDANDAAENAQEQLEALQEVGAKYENAVIEATTVAAGSNATGAISEVTTNNITKKKFTLGRPKGATGEKGAEGDKGPKDLTFAFDAETGRLTVTRITD